MRLGQNSATLAGLTSGGVRMDKGNSRVMGTVIFVGALVVVNILSYVLHWGFWLY